MGLYLGSTKIPTISLYKSGAITPTGIKYISTGIAGTAAVSSYAFVVLDLPPDLIRERLTGDLITYSNSTPTSVASYAFAGTNITSIDLPNVETIYPSAFQGCLNLSSIYFPKLSSIGSWAFADCTNLTSFSFPLCTKIGPGANVFLRCGFTSISLPSTCTTLSDGAFAECVNLSYFNGPSLSTILNNIFSDCSLLTQIYLPICSSIGNYAFYKCVELSSINLSACTYLGQYAFSGCSKLQNVNIPKLKAIPYECFWNCKSLSILSAPACSNISGYAFENCSSFMSLYLMSTSVATLSNSNAFNYTPMKYSTYTGSFGSIFVPSSLVDSYKAATNWVNLSDRIVGI